MLRRTYCTSIDASDVRSCTSIDAQTYVAVNGITLSIPENAISFQDTDMVTVTLSAESESTYVVDILVNGERAVPQKSFTLWFPKICSKAQNRLW